VKKLSMAILISVLFSLLGTTTSFALSLYVDASPNVYGSPLYSDWKTSTFAAVASGTFQNMANGINTANIGTTNFEIQDEVVYSFGDLGKRLTWIYWIPNATVESLDGHFEISLINIWGADSPIDFYNDYYGSTWLEPTTWTNYNGGVIGTAGMAWWGAYGVDTQEALEADLAEWGAISESWIFTAKLNGTETSITSNRDAVAAVPEPSTILLLGSGLVGIFAYGRKRSKV